MKIKPLTVGPIIGETTTNRVRIWGRGDSVLIDGEPRRCFGALRTRRSGRTSWDDPVIFKMNPNFDMTGIGIVEGLRQNTKYDYQIGIFYSEAEFEGIDLDDADWKKACSGSFRTAIASARAPREIVFGSCRYLLRTFLGSVFDSRGDKTFRSIREQIDDGDEIHQLLMVGDQIYADDMNFFLPDTTIEKFYGRYRDAFGQKHLKSVMRHVPTYMILDDHEIEDNWPARASSQDMQKLFPVAMHAYQAYQMSHGPCIGVRNGRLMNPPSHYWYTHTDGCCDQFVTDCRTERNLESSSREMLGREQISALKSWLADGSGRAKLIVTSVPFFPDHREGNTDKWSGFPEQRNDLLGFIEEHQIKKVVFLSGDIHASLSVQLTSPTGLKITSVVSSAFFWPYPHPSRTDYQTRGNIDAGHAGTFRLSGASRVVADDNFTRLTVKTDGLQVRVFRRKGEQALTKSYRF